MHIMQRARLTTTWTDGDVHVSTWQDIRIANECARLLKAARDEDGVAIATVDVEPIAA